MAPFSSFLRQFGAPDVFFPGAPACTWNCMAPLSSFSPSIWRPWCFLPWSPCLYFELHGAPLVFFSVNLAPLTFSSPEPLLALETAWRPSRHIDLLFVLSFFFLVLSLFLFFLIPFFSSFFLLSPPSLSLSFFSFPFFFLFGAPLVTPGGPGPPKPPPPRYAPEYTPAIVGRIFGHSHCRLQGRLLCTLAPRQDTGVDAAWSEVHIISEEFTREIWGSYENCIVWNKIMQIQRNNYSWLYFVKSY